jgi:hypothetical protein
MQNQLVVNLDRSVSERAVEKSIENQPLERRSMKTVISGALGECVHVAEVTNILYLTGQSRWRKVSLDQSVSIRLLKPLSERGWIEA